MSDALSPSELRKRPIDVDLDFAEGDLSDDDTEVVEGLKQLKVMRSTVDESVLELRLPAWSERSAD